MIKLFEDHKSIYPNAKTRIRRANFLKVTKLLCSKGTIKTGLSYYYVKLRDAGRVFDRMMKRIAELENIIGIGFEEGSYTIENDSKYLLSKWEALDQFLQYEYSAHHVKLDDECRCHCYRFGLNLESEHCYENCNNNICRRSISMYSSRNSIK